MRMWMLVDLCRSDLRVFGSHARPEAPIEIESDGGNQSSLHHQKEVCRTNPSRYKVPRRSPFLRQASQEAHPRGLVLVPLVS